MKKYLIITNLLYLTSALAQDLPQDLPSDLLPIHRSETKSFPVVMSDIQVVESVDGTPDSMDDALKRESSMVCSSLTSKRFPLEPKRSLTPLTPDTQDPPLFDDRALKSLTNTDHVTFPEHESRIEDEDEYKLSISHFKKDNTSDQGLLSKKELWTEQEYISYYSRIYSKGTVLIITVAGGRKEITL